MAMHRMTLTVSAEERRRMINILRERRGLNDEDDPPTIYGYARVSHYDSAESGLSIEDQVRTIERWREILLEDCEGTVAGEIFIDRAQSAWKKPLACRPGGRSLLGALKPGDHVVFKRLDRGFRQAHDFHTQLAKWDAQGITFHATDVRLDTSTPLGRCTIAIAVAFAQYEAELISARNRDIANRRRVQTRSNHLASGPRAQIGYRTAGPPKKRHLLPHKGHRRWLAFIRYLCNDDHHSNGVRLSHGRIAEILNLLVQTLAEKGTPEEEWRDDPWTARRVHRWHVRAIELDVEPQPWNDPGADHGEASPQSA